MGLYTEGLHIPEGGGLYSDGIIFGGLQLILVLLTDTFGTSQICSLQIGVYLLEVIIIVFCSSPPLVTRW